MDLGWNTRRGQLNIKGDPLLTKRVHSRRRFDKQGDRLPGDFNFTPTIRGDQIVNIFNGAAFALRRVAFFFSIFTV